VALQAREASENTLVHLTANPKLDEASFTSDRPVNASRFGLPLRVTLMGSFSLIGGGILSIVAVLAALRRAHAWIQGSGGQDIEKATLILLISCVVLPAAALAQRTYGPCYTSRSRAEFHRSQSVSRVIYGHR
jgi:hypothetical protein